MAQTDAPQSTISRPSPLAPTLPARAATAVRWCRLHGAARALAIARAAQAHRGFCLVLCTDSPHAAQLDAELPFFAPALPQYQLPDWETLPYDRFSPYQDIISERLATLAALPTLSRGVLIMSVTSLLHRLPPRQWLQAQSFVLKAGDELDREGFRRRLQEGGYRSVPQVMDHGDFAIRGSLIDVFPMGAAQPFRIDLFGDEIEALRHFDPETQRSTSIVDSLRILPGREVPLTAEAIANFRRNWRLAFEGRPTKSPVYEDISDGVAPAGIEYYLPLFYDSVSSVFDYLPADTLVIVDGDIDEAAAAFRRSVEERYEQLRHDLERPILPPERLFLAANEVEAELGRRTRIRIDPETWEERAKAEVFGTRPGPRLPIDSRARQPLFAVTEFLSRFDGRVLFLAESTGRRETMLELFRANGVSLPQAGSWAEFEAGEQRVALAVAPLAEGVEIESPKLALVTELQLFGERASQRRRRRRSNVDQDAVVRNLAELRVGAPVVHEMHGIGRYLGLEVLQVGDVANEFIKLEYADGDKLYVPVSALALIGRYTGIDPDRAPLHKLGSGQWDKAKRKAAERIRDVAAELLEIHARRAARKGHAFAIEREAYRAFEQGFPFEETPDQLAAIEAVIENMQKPQPMDRLVCGDVGFGKTEVAMRAAFIAVNGGRQVAVLVPTTLLAQQHYQTFRDRFADWPVRIAQLSRFRDSGEVKDTLKGLAAGTVDIVIGTHKLLGREVKFKDLGLVIIDEEHRFGVRQKEQFKALRSEVDLLTLTATPIPRTLNMALSGTRELSVIATAPSKRLAVQTFLYEWSDELVREAILRELARGGQVYFVHNEVENIERIAETVAALVPSARVRFAHGQMREKELEQVMLDFYHRRCNVLVCTTIIETGIDVPNANTMIINRADRYGLAQLYQLRGRVGRSHHRAYAYLIVPPRKAMTADAVKRLEAIEALEDLGVGFTLATHDMEIRGAGEILGEDQSGQIQEIGFGLYADLLNRAVAALKSGKQPDFEAISARACEIDLHVPALLPEDHLPDVHARLVLYKRIASSTSEADLTLLKEELIDRLGPCGPAVDNLFRVTALRLKADVLGIKRIDFTRQGGVIEFRPQPNVEPIKVIRLIQSTPHYRLEGQDKLRLRKDLPDEAARFTELEKLLERLA
ncbi:MAG TPA: transcription-repair coupling factor [Gammaproteobacteria bacterium]|nr:transcription-repair coupling factor [Gammaproteobacteria bacterium]